MSPFAVKICGKDYLKCSRYPQMKSSSPVAFENYVYSKLDMKNDVFCSHRKWFRWIPTVTTPNHSTQHSITFRHNVTNAMSDWAAKKVKFFFKSSTCWGNSARSNAKFWIWKIMWADRMKLIDTCGINLRLEYRESSTHPDKWISQFCAKFARKSWKMGR